MNIVMVEDEVMVARRLTKFCQAILGEKIDSLKHFLTLDDAEEYLAEHSIDLLLLDLNLNGQDGFDILKRSVAASYQTIVVSANIDRALEAFEYGVLDFVGKPFKQERLEKAFERLLNTHEHGTADSRYLSVKKMGRIEVIELQNIRYIRAASHYSELVLLDGKTELHDKNLERLLMVLPARFERVHKSYVVPMDQIKALLKHPGSKYELKLHNDECIPLGRTRYGAIRAKLEG
ncbi:MAG: LytTR family DNA-binding domain-containing protein [Psychrosphaera sp.]|nr:LytTR family DNA-binding domain-containing protein [Psychrosphaera sp.]